MKKLPKSIAAKYLGQEEKRKLYNILLEESGLLEQLKEAKQELYDNIREIITDNFPEDFKNNLSERVLKTYSSFRVSLDIFGIESNQYPSENFPRKLGEEELEGNILPVQIDIYLSKIPMFDPSLCNASTYTSAEWKIDCLDPQKSNNIRDLILNYAELLFRKENFLRQYIIGGNSYNSEFLKPVTTWGRLYNINKDWFNKLAEWYNLDVSSSDEEDNVKMNKSDIDVLVEKLHELRALLGFS